MAESHVRELNDIFGNTMFTTKINGQQITFRGIQFEIRQVQVRYLASQSFGPFLTETGGNKIRTNQQCTSSLE